MVSHQVRQRSAPPEQPWQAWYFSLLGAERRNVLRRNDVLLDSNARHRTQDALLLVLYSPLLGY